MYIQIENQLNTIFFKLMSDSHLLCKMQLCTFNRERMFLFICILPICTLQIYQVVHVYFYKFQIIIF